MSTDSTGHYGWWHTWRGHKRADYPAASPRPGRLPSVVHGGIGGDTMSGRRPVRRVPVSRRPRRRPRRRRSHGRDSEQLLTVIAVLAGVGLVVALVKWLLAHWVVLVVLAALAAGAGAVWWQRQQQRRQWQEAQQRGLRYQLVQLDTLHHAQFEHAIRDLMVRDGCPEAARTGGRGDQGADVIATDPAGLRWVIQCKHRRNGLHGSAVGTPTCNGSTAPQGRCTAPTWWSC